MQHPQRSGGRGTRDLMPHRGCPSYPRIEVVLRPRPECGEHAIRAAARYQQRLHVRCWQGVEEHRHRWVHSEMVWNDLRERVAHNAELGRDDGIERDEHDTASRDTHHLREAGATPGGRCPIITGEGSTAVTSRSRGSYEPIPTPTLRTVRASPSAARRAPPISGPPGGSSRTATDAVVKRTLATHATDETDRVANTKGWRRSLQEPDGSARSRTAIAS